MEDFSVAIIARNEENVLSRLLDSLKGVEDIVVVSTGSTDRTVEIAKKYGCNVVEVGDKFRKIPTLKQVKEFKDKFGIDPSFEAGKGYFHFADARNYAMSLCKHDMIFQPDADEIVDWDLEKVKSQIEGQDHLVYQFCFAHNADGTPGLEFQHSKMFRRSKLKWIGHVHEIHSPVAGQTPKPPFYTDDIYLHHWQEHKEERGSYLPGLELAVLAGENLDRNMYYLAREYYYNQRWADAIVMFEKALLTMWWKPERGQAYIFLSRCYRSLGGKDEAKECLLKSLAECDTRREPWFELGEMFPANPAYYGAAMQVPFNPHGYLNDKNLYGHVIPEKLSIHYGKAGNYEESKHWWLEALKNNPPPHLLKAFENFYGKAPLISIVVPTCRPEGFQRLKKSIEQHTLYPNWEIIERPEPGTAVEKFNKGVEAAKGDYVVFMADDTEATQGWLIQAFVCLKEKLRGKGLVIFNDNHWGGTLCNHFLCSKNIRDELDGEIWCSEYKHCSVDVELHCRLKAKNLVEYCPEAKIVHYQYFCTSKGTKPDPKDAWNQQVNEWSGADRMLLPKRLEKLGLHEDAVKYQKWFDKLLQGDPDKPERTVVGKIAPVPSYEALRYGLAAKTPCRTVLDLGCSNGFGSRFFEGKDYLGVDYNPDVIMYAKDQYGSDKVKFVCADVHDFKLGQYDTIIAFEFLEHLKGGKELAQKLKKHCNHLFCTVPYEEPVGEWGKYHLIHGLREADFPGFEYQWMHPDGKLYDKPDPVCFNLMFLHWSK